MAWTKKCWTSQSRNSLAKQALMMVDGSNMMVDGEKDLWQAQRLARGWDVSFALPRHASQGELPNKVVGKVVMLRFFTFEINFPIPVQKY